ncbi:MAG: PLP-dependent aspartate aminotransferase family protein [Gammaproteobacteria bacterium]|nr:PLP-dependent aspartate aminotransferase family protein [Gammaproteobacteria bacterium]
MSGGEEPQSEETGLRTKAIHAGESIDPNTGASAPNLVMSTTFAMAQPGGFSISDFAGDDVPFIYSRWGNPTVRQLEEKLTVLENADDCIAFASGMAATAGLLLGTLNSGDHLVISDTNYAGTAELVRKTLPRMGIQVSIVDTSDIQSVRSAMRDDTKMLWIETPANPILRLADIAELAQTAHEYGASLAVDSTFATPIATRPIELGADYVVHSLTKYIGGHGDALGGAVLGSKPTLAQLRNEALVHQGGVLSPFNAWLIARGAATLPIRMQAHEANALVLAEFLENHPGVTQVNYPGLSSHPQHDLAKRQMTNFSGMISFQTDNGTELARRMAKELDIIHYAVSLGHHRSLICWIATADIMASTFQLPERQLAAYRSFAGDGLFRLSVGLEDPEDLCRDLDRVLTG